MTSNQIKFSLFSAIIRWSVCISMILFMCALFLLVNTRVKYDSLFESHFTSDKSMTLYGIVALILCRNVQRKGVKEERGYNVEARIDNHTRVSV